MKPLQFIVTAVPGKSLFRLRVPARLALHVSNVGQGPGQVVVAVIDVNSVQHDELLLAPGDSAMIDRVGVADLRVLSGSGLIQCAGSVEEDGVSLDWIIEPGMTALPGFGDHGFHNSSSSSASAFSSSSSSSSSLHSSSSSSQSSESSESSTSLSSESSFPAPAAFADGDWELHPLNAALQVIVLSLPDPGNDAIEFLQYRYRTDGDYSSWTSRGDTNNFTIPDLDNGALYEVQLRGVNAAGPGPDGDSKTATPVADAAPTELTFLHAISGSATSAIPVQNLNPNPGNGIQAGDVCVIVNRAGGNGPAIADTAYPFGVGGDTTRGFMDVVSGSVPSVKVAFHAAVLSGDESNLPGMELSGGGLFYAAFLFRPNGTIESIEWVPAGKQVTQDTLPSSQTITVEAEDSRPILLFGAMIAQTTVTPNVSGDFGVVPVGNNFRAHYLMCGVGDPASNQTYAMSGAAGMNRAMMSGYFRFTFATPE